MYVLEAIIAGFLLLGTIVAVQSVFVSSSPSNSQLAQLKATGDDTLRALDLTPPGTPQGRYDYANSTLVKLVATNDTAAMRQFLSRSLPENARYEVALRNASTLEVWIDGQVPRDGEVVVSHRIVAFRDPPLGLGGTVIDVQLRLWFV